MVPLDLQLLRAVAESPGAMVADVVRPFLRKYSNSQLRHHLDLLEAKGYLVQDRKSVSGRVFVTITKQGREYLVQ